MQWLLGPHVHPLYMLVCYMLKLNCYIMCCYNTLSGLTGDCFISEGAWDASYPASQFLSYTYVYWRNTLALRTQSTCCERPCTQTESYYLLTAWVRPFYNYIKRPAVQYMAGTLRRSLGCSPDVMKVVHCNGWGGRVSVDAARPVSLLTSELWTTGRRGIA